MAFRFPADVRCDAVVPRFRVGTAGRFFFTMASISALKNPGKKFPLDRYIMKAYCSSCVSMTPFSAVSQSMESIELIE
jgi:hypothetical protein